MKGLFSHLTLAATLLLASCTGGKQTVDLSDRHKEPNVEIIQDMMDQPAIKAQGYDPFHPDQPGERLPPEGTVPQGFQPYAYHLDPVGAEKLKNPLAGDLGPSILEQGHKRFETYCTPCHGGLGKGDGLVAAKLLLKPANLISTTIVEKSDAHYFHVITDGYGGMGSYGGQIPNERDRWAITNYVRSLQQLAGATAKDTASASNESKKPTR